MENSQALTNFSFSKRNNSDYFAIHYIIDFLLVLNFTKKYVHFTLWCLATKICVET